MSGERESPDGEFERSREPAVGVLGVLHQNFRGDPSSLDVAIATERDPVRRRMLETVQRNLRHEKP